MNKNTFFIVLSIFLVQIVPAQTYLSVKIDNPVYILLNNAEQRGIIPFLPTAKPYTKAEVIKLLKQIREREEDFSEQEKATLNFYLDNMQNNYTGLSKGNFTGSGDPGQVKIGLDLSGNYRVNINNPESWHMYNGIIAYLKGDISNFLSYYGTAGGSIDKIAPDFFYKHITMEATEKMLPLPSPYYIENGTVQSFTGEMHDYTPPGAFAPYQFTAIWDGHHTNPFTSGLNDGVMPEPSVALTTRDEIAASFYNGDLLFRLGRIRREWGNGDGSLYLSGTARPFEGFETQFSPAPWFEYSWVVGSLGSWFVDSYIDMEKYAEYTKDPVNYTDPYPTLGYFSEQKMLTLQQFVLKPTDYLSLLVSSSAIWGKRFEMTYLSPMLLPFMAQEYNGDVDNVNLSMGFTARVPFAGKIYGTLFLDETSGSDFSTIFTFPRNMYAYQGGIKTPIPGLPFATLTLQYSKINPFVYSHYFEEDYAGFTVPVSMTYTNDGENLGYFLPPNADEILVKLETFPKPNLYASLKYQLIRHGTNDTSIDADGDGNPDGQIYGDIYIPFDYSQNSNYPLKDFLNDGVYDWSNIISLKGEYTFPGYPLKMGIEYIFSYTFWDTNGRSVANPGSITQNIVSFSFTLF